MLENESRIPDDFQSALALNATASEVFARLNEADKRRYLAGIHNAGAVDERMARIDEVVQALSSI